MATSNLAERLLKAFREYTAMTGLELNVEHLQFRVHPADWREWRAGWRTTYGIEPLHDTDIYGVQVFLDDTVDIGEPELCSTWKVKI